MCQKTVPTTYVSYVPSGYSNTGEVYTDGYCRNSINLTVSTAFGYHICQLATGSFVSWNIATQQCQNNSVFYTCPPNQNWTLSGPNCVRPDTKANGPAVTCNGSNPSTGHPITLGTGNKWLIEDDLIDSVAGNVSSLRLTRTYNKNTGTVSSRFGARWRADYDQQLGFDGSANNLMIWAYRPDGKSIKFVLTSGNYIPDADITERLYRETNTSGTTTGYRLEVSDNSIERYDTAGKLLSITDSAGRLQSMSYNAQGLLASVTDSMGRSLGFVYDASNRIATVTDPSGSVITYGYDANNNLVSVTYQNGSVRRYHYENATLKNALTGITDENGVRYITYSYDVSGKAIGETLSGSVGSYGLSFGTNQTTVTDPLGAVRTYNFQTILGVQKSTGVSQPGGSGCGAASSAIGYDANGNVASRTDFDGHKTTYSYDLARNLETQRKEGLNGDGSVRPETRTVSTQWHGYWRLPAKVAEPKKLTTLVYNGDTYNGSVVSCAPSEATVPSITGGTQPIGVLCRKIEQATTDANGSQGFSASATGTPRTWAWTYNRYGMVLTADGPRTDVNDVTTYTYYDAADPDLGKRGNLATVTDPLGHVTQLTRYNAHGQVKEIVDPNGVTTTLTYDLRQRLTSRSTAGETTGYQYDQLGQLTRLTLPDGSFLAYTWDAAHRLTDVTDGLGNSIHYTLDAAGNRTKEDVKDPQGTLVKTLTRSYDALGRLQTLTGVAEE